LTNYLEARDSAAYILYSSTQALFLFGHENDLIVEELMPMLEQLSLIWPLKIIRTF